MGIQFPLHQLVALGVPLLLKVNLQELAPQEAIFLKLMLEGQVRGSGCLCAWGWTRGSLSMINTQIHLR